MPVESSVQSIHHAASNVAASGANSLSSAPISSRWGRDEIGSGNCAEPHRLCSADEGCRRDLRSCGDIHACAHSRMGKGCSVTTATAISTSVRLSCARCSTSHRVRDVYALKPGMNASCTSCGAIFVVVSLPAVSLDEAVPSHAVDETPRQDPRLVDQEATRAEEAQRFGSKPRKAVFHGAGGTLFGIHLVNTLRHAAHARHLLLLGQGSRSNIPIRPNRIRRRPILVSRERSRTPQRCTESQSGLWSSLLPIVPRGSLSRAQHGYSDRASSRRVAVVCSFSFPLPSSARGATD